VAERESIEALLRDALDAFGDEEAEQVVAAAHEEAVERATAILADAMTRSLLENARTYLPAPAPPPERAPAPASPAEGRAAPAEAPEVLAHYVYGIARTGSDAVPEGIDGIAEGRAPFAVEHGRLTAIVSLVPLNEFGEDELHENLNDVEWLEHTARAHESVLGAALAASTVVPLRLCTIYRDEDHVRQMLDREGAVFEDALHRLEGKTEWGVKLIAEPGALEQASLRDRESPESGSLSRGAAYMKSKSRQAQAREEADRTAEEWSELVHRRVGARAAEALLNPLQNPELSGHTGEMLLNGVYLVEDADEGAFRDEVSELAAEFEALGASVELTGPWPPYNFVKGSIEAAR
jgi:hypothetical protein